MQKRRATFFVCQQKSVNLSGEKLLSAFLVQWKNNSFAFKWSIVCLRGLLRAFFMNENWSNKDFTGNQTLKNVAILLVSKKTELTCGAHFYFSCNLIFVYLLIASDKFRGPISILSIAKLIWEFSWLQNKLIFFLCLLLKCQF